jgi:hypothetical protein
MISCEKDETKVFLLDNPVAPVLVTVPDLTFQKANENDTLSFRGTPAYLGFSASMRYVLEACPKDNGFKTAKTVRIYIGDQDSLITITEKALNSKMLPKFPKGIVAAADFRIRAIIAVDAGTGALGSSTNPLEVKSELTTLDVLTY